VDIQAIFHDAKLFSRQEASDWCENNSFITEVYRAREEDGIVTHHIHAQFDTALGVDGTWKTIANDFPEGVSASVCERKNLSNALNAAINKIEAHLSR